MIPCINALLLKVLNTSIRHRMGARLCLHHRDFAPGKTIFENIVYSLEMSKNCVIILSKDYAKSEWCRFEAQARKIYLSPTHNTYYLLERQF